MGLLLLVDQPFERVLILVASVAPPMLIMNLLGTATLIAIMENIFREQEVVEGSAARLALQIAGNTNCNCILSCKKDV
jgi:two-component system sensor histidine kinase LytS